MTTRQFTRRDLSLLLPLLLILVVAMLQRSTAGFTMLELGLLLIIPGVGTWAVLVWRTTSQQTNLMIPHSIGWLLLFGAWSVMSVFPAMINGVDPITWGRRLFPLITLITVTLVTAFAIRSRRHVSLLYAAIVGIQIITVLVSLSGLLSVDLSTINNLQYLRNFGSAEHAGVLMLLLLPFVVNYRHFNRIQQIVAVTGFIIAATGLLISFTRTIWIATASGAGFTAVVYLHRRSLDTRVFMFRILILLSGLIPLLFVTPDKLLVFLSERLRSIPNALQSASLQDRLFELRGLLTDTVANPLMMFVGHGLGAEFTFYSVNQYSWDGVGKTYNSYSHNYYAYLLWSIGIVGLSFFVRYWQLIFRNGIRVLLHDGLNGDRFYLLGCMGAIVSLLVSSLTGPLLYDVRWGVIFGMVGGILIYIIHNYPAQNGATDRMESP
jgi:hypothetical protein